ncbi:MAG: type II secretion system protein [Phycisphaeraceae bacterium]
MCREQGVGLIFGDKKRFLLRSSGFSLVELLVVISIIGLLVAIGATVAVQMSKEGRKQQMRAMMDGMLGANDEFKAVREQANINHTTSYPINWDAIGGGSLSSSERFVLACSQIKACEEILLAAIRSGTSQAFDRMYQDSDGDTVNNLIDWWGTEIEYRSFNDGNGTGPSTNVDNDDLPISKQPFFASAGPDKTWGTDDDVNTVQLR